jgi:hypothetical protein
LVIGAADERFVIEAIVFACVFQVRSRTVGHEADATKFGGVRQYSGKSGSKRFTDL